MAKAIKWYIKLQINWWQANPAPPVWPALWQYWVPIQEFTSKFNEQTKDRMWLRLPVIITVYEDRSFDFIVKQPPMTTLIKNKLNIKSGSKLPHKEKIAHLTLEQMKEIANEKMPDLNAIDLAGALMSVRGSARSAWITTDIDWLKKEGVVKKL